MKIKSMICVALMLGAVTIASAQEENSYNKVYASFVTGGASFSGIGSVTDDMAKKYVGTDRFGLNGFNIGYAHGFKLTGPLFLEGGLEFNYAAGTESVYKNDCTAKTMSFAIPVNLTYQFAISDKFTIAPLAGINFKYNLSAKETTDVNGKSYECNFFDSDDIKKTFGIDETANRFQFGMNLGVNFVYAKHYMLGYRFQHDFSNFFKYEVSGDGGKLVTNYHYITLGYIF